MADNFKRVSATGTGSLVVIATVPSSNLSTTPPTEPAVKHLTTTQVLEQGDTVKVKGSGLKFSINFMEII